MELPDEAVTYQYQSLLVPTGEEWTAAAELRAKHFLQPSRLKDLSQRVLQARSQVAAEREMRGNLSPEVLPLEPGFIDLPQQSLDDYRRKGDQSALGKVLLAAANLRENADRVIFLASGGSALPAQILFSALRSSYHNELPSETRLGVPRFYFEGDNCDNDALQDLLDVIQVSCVDPENRDERWAVVLLSKSGSMMETNIAHRVLRRDAVEYYGLRSEWLHHLFVPVTGNNSPLRQVFRGLGYADEKMLTVPDNVGSRFSACTAIGLLPAALMGLDVRAYLQGAAVMTKRFLEEPFERNPILQFAAVNYLMTQELGKPIRVMSLWSKKLEPLGRWYDQLVAESLSKCGQGPTPISQTMTRDLHVRGQHNQEGPRDRVLNNIVIKNARTVPIGVQMADRNEDELNQFARRTLADVMLATHQGTRKAFFETARPSADVVVPSLSEHTLGQLLQMLMLATVVEARLMGVNPYSHPGVEIYRRNIRDALKG